jgi:uncharacterized Zn finger protein
MAQSPTPPVWVFGVRLVMEVINASHLPANENYKPTSYLYDKKGERKGVFAKGLALKDKVIVKKISFDGDNWEVEALVPSESSPSEKYAVRIYTPLDFECSCPWGSHRFRPCKHVFAATLKILEIAGADVGDPILRHYVYEGLNRLAYHKAKTHHQLA